MAGAFAVQGLYRTQSHRRCERATLAGRWFEAPGALSSDDANHLLTGQAWWRGGECIALRAALVDRRSGPFTEADALYYRAFFTPDEGGSAWPADIVDVTKLLSHWRERWPSVQELFAPEVSEGLAADAGDVAVTAVNEYLCHEAGHRAGWDVVAKYESGWFRRGGRTAWPLVFVEEARADLHGLGVAARGLSREAARAVFAYHLGHRFGLARLAATTGCPGAGAVPFLLFAVLVEVGHLTFDRDGRAVLGTDPIGAMEACDDHALDRLTQLELDGADPLDVAINVAAYFRERMAVSEHALAFRRWMTTG